MWENANTNLSLLLCKHSIKMSQICKTLKQLAFLKFHLMVISLQHLRAYSWQEITIVPEPCL